ncbi:hypothetical protein N0V88_006160 [Collariella sp. IMI 366227]|nr:hypothetical protein N0V88_006160 [Collariella sp. IMI 366227]
MTTIPSSRNHRLHPSCIRILAGNPSKFTLQGTNTYLLGSGPTRLLIDTGEGKPSWIAALKTVLREEKATVMELVKVIYKDVNENLHPAAAGGVVQILQKLLREGRVLLGEDGESWRLAGSGSGRSAL